MSAVAMDVGALSAKDLARIEGLLVQRFCPPLTADSVARCLGDCAARFAHARVRNFLSILVEREAADRLRDELQRSCSGDRTPALGPDGSSAGRTAREASTAARMRRAS